MAKRILPFALILVGLFKSVECLSCYSCIDINSNKIISRLSTMGHTAQNCQNSPSKRKQCQVGQVCGYVYGNVDVAVNSSGLETPTNETFTIHARDCMKVLANTTMNCHKYQGRTDILNEPLSFITGLTDVKLDGNMCFCNTDACRPDTNPDCPDVNIFGICFPIWSLVLAGIGLVLIIGIDLCKKHTALANLSRPS
ncbi:unnamed protein product [Owenia fusiformis]|uniref:Protein quiver n=1 Tax=Owenia fusiformis TaxID=6347 RepID=A0A8S4N6V4_OWEFU|nr:unnamed protein product [Owenia fusiformis]